MVSDESRSWAGPNVRDPTLWPAISDPGGRRPRRRSPRGVPVRDAGSVRDDAGVKHRCSCRNLRLHDRNRHRGLERSPETGRREPPPSTPYRSNDLPTAPHEPDGPSTAPYRADTSPASSYRADTYPASSHRFGTRWETTVLPPHPVRPGVDFTGVRVHNGGDGRRRKSPATRFATAAKRARI